MGLLRGIFDNFQRLAIWVTYETLMFRNPKWRKVMEVYQVGQDEADFGHVEDFVWVVYDYTIGDWSGDGEAIALRKDGMLVEFNLGHCSCYGPTDEFPNGGEVHSAEQYLRPIVSAIDERSNPIVDKIRELLGVS